MSYLDINPPQSEDIVSSRKVFIEAEIITINGEESYLIEGSDLAEINPIILKEIIIDLIKLEK